MASRQSPLGPAHRRLGAKMVSFGGWEMPLSYPKGTIAEHLSCRRAAVAFDVSHLGTIRVEGPDAFERLQSTLTNDLRRIGPGRAQYSHLLDEGDGSVVDDLIVWWLEADTFDVMPNAANTDRVLEAIGGIDVTSSRAVVAVQGPLARQRLAPVAPAAAALGRFAVTRFEWQGLHGVAAGTGYTGEDGVECALPAEEAERFWWAVLEAGIEPAGLGARDTLRLEAGFPLHGHELGPGITPLQAGLDWVVSWEKGPFRGRRALVAERGRGIARRLSGLVTDGRRPPRAGDAVLADAVPVGRVTSGNYSPVLKVGVALALLDPSIEVHRPVEISARGRLLSATVEAPPFVSEGRPRPGIRDEPRASRA